MRILPLAAALTAIAFAAAAPAQQRAAPFTIAESGLGYPRLQQAVDAIGAGQGTILIAPGTYRQCAVQQAGTVAYRSAQPGAAVFAGTICEGKAALVLRGRSARVEGIVFQDMAVSDGNGAGIRLEAGDLLVDNSLFRQSQQGLLTAGFPGGSITIRRSTFMGLGRCDGGLDCAHSVYIGDYGNLTIQQSRFEAGMGGHYVKSRARIVHIVGNSFDDSAGHETNYMIDLPNGTVGEIANNEMVQGRDKDNYSAFIALGAEGRERPSTGLSITGNSASFVPGLSRQSAFLADWTGDRVVTANNRLAAGIAPLSRR